MLLQFRINKPRIIKKSNNDVNNNIYFTYTNKRHVKKNNSNSVEIQVQSEPTEKPKIPLHIYQTWHTLDLPTEMKKNVELLKIQNPEFTHHLYDDAMCREFIEQNFEEDVLHAFDKLKPGAYKADLWRYCILYKYGGIYLDIKFYCMNGFKLLYLTDKEYYVKDRVRNSNNGIYQALLSVYPNNNKMYQCIYQIVKNVQNNFYGYNPLCTTGPHLVSLYFTKNDFVHMNLYFTEDGNFINFKKYNLLGIYKDYRNEQANVYTPSLVYYYDMWNFKNIYNYPTLHYKSKHDFSSTITKYINNVKVVLFAGTPTIIKITPNTYMVNIRWINYEYYENGSKKNIPKQWISLNSRFIVDENFNKISDEIFLEENFNKNPLFYNKLLGLGLEDIRLFQYNDIYYYISSYYDTSRKVTSVSSGIYNMNEEQFKLNRRIILPTMYDLNMNKKIEKNWSFVIYKNELCVVYDWFPLQIGKIDYLKNKMNIIEIKKNVPENFKDARGSTSGIIKDNEIWFVAHKAQSYVNQDKKYFNYQHFFAVFDLDMNLLRYSELFKLGDCKVEFCIGLIINDTEMILSYSLLDTQCIIATYDIDYINNGIKWYQYAPLVL